NLGLELALEGLGIPLLRARVGDRYVLEMLLEHEGALGGESSGHIICLDRTTTGDGIVAALQVLCCMRVSGEPLSRLREGMTKLPQHMVSVPVARRLDPFEVPSIAAAVQAVEAELGNDGRVLLRSSGTEPVIRVMIEGQNRRRVRQLTDLLAARVAEALVADPVVVD
ncbi:MAG: phosphoglucosamine mutase, partial [Nitrococcus sp.]|nr:phosphoglucosamine mutase [Nitrococcus sp.]